MQSPKKLNEDIINADVNEHAPAANIVFGTMMSHILNSLKKIDASLITELRSELNMKIVKMQLKNERILVVLRWLKGQVRVISVELPFGLLREIITQVYTLTCDYYGPDVADRVLQQAAKACREIPEAREVSPGNFL